MSDQSMMNDSMTVHHVPNKKADLSQPDPHQDAFSMTFLGFWFYIITDCLIFTTLFTTYAVMKSETFGGVRSQDIFELSTAFAETMLLLVSSVTCGLAVLAAVKSQRVRSICWLAITFLIGASFIFLELKEFSSLVEAGHGWEKSAFLSAFFTLVGSHGLHVSVGLFWMCVMMAQLFFKGITVSTFRRLVIFSLFWHFLDLIWIFIFTFVYLMGVA